MNEQNNEIAINFQDKLIQLASDVTFDVSKLQALWEMNKENEIIKSKKKCYSDLALAKAEMPKIIRSKSNFTFSSKYAALEDIHEIIDPILGKYNMSVVYDNKQNDNNITVKAILLHGEGYDISTEISVPVSSITSNAGKLVRTPLQDISASLTSAKRYVVCSLLGLVTEDTRDNDASNYISEDAALDFKDRIIALGGGDDDIKKFLTLAKTDDFNKIQSKDFYKLDNALKAIEVKNAKVS